MKKLNLSKVYETSKLHTDSSVLIGESKTTSMSNNSSNRGVLNVNFRQLEQENFNPNYKSRAQIPCVSNSIQNSGMLESTADLEAFLNQNTMQS